MDNFETTTDSQHTGIHHIEFSVIIPKFAPLLCLQLSALYDEVSVFSSIIGLHTKQPSFIADKTEFFKNLRTN
jgi:hypothetical protein